MVRGMTSAAPLLDVVIPVYNEQAGLARSVRRLHRYLARQDSGIADEPATARALAGYLLRGLDCGALTDAGFPRSDLLTLAR